MSFQVTPSSDGSLVFQYVFASEEYLEYVGVQYNDRFRLLVNGKFPFMYV